MRNACNNKINDEYFNMHFCSMTMLLLFYTVYYVILLRARVQCSQWEYSVIILVTRTSSGNNNNIVYKNNGEWLFFIKDG